MRYNPKLCNCGSGLERHELIDAAGIFCTFVCEKCETDRRKDFNPAIFDAEHRYAMSGKEDDLEIDYDG